MTTTAQLIDAIHERGLEQFNKYYGVYRATVSAINDPEKRGRVQVKVAAMGHSDSIPIWVESAFLGVGNGRGMFWIPEVGDPVRVFFERGDSAHPIFYVPGWFGLNWVPSEFEYSSNGTPEKKGFVTRLGHRLVFSDVPGTESVHLSCHFPDSRDPANSDKTKTSDRATGTSSFIDFSKTGLNIVNKNGSIISLDNENNAITIIDENSNVISLNKDGISIIDKDGQSISMSGNSINITPGKEVTINASNVTLNSGSVFLGSGATFSSVLGEFLLTWLNTHVHTTTTPSVPTSPPLVPATPALLSNSVKIKN